MFSHQFRRRALIALATILTLSACDVSQQSTSQQTQPAPPAQQAPGGQGQLNPGQPQITAAPGAPTSEIVGLTDQQIGLGGVAQAQPQPTPTLFAAGEGNLLAEYERTINNVYARNIGALVNLTDGNSTGSGFIIDQQGHIVTNNHVAGQMQEINITFSDRTSTLGRLVGTFPEGDIAVVKVDRLPPGVQPVELGDSGLLQVGQITVAMGSPLGLEQTVTSGIVSALNRSITDVSRQFDQDTLNSSLQGLIQTDAPINPGNSGGPLFDSRGRVIGMNTLIATRATSSETAGSIGLGFAVPINRIKRVAAQIIQTGRYERPRLGVQINPITPEIAQELNLPVTSGVMIGEVTGQQAQAAGLQGAQRFVQLQTGSETIDYPVDGDIIVAINNVPIRTVGDLRNAIETQANPGDTVTITFLRDGREQSTRVTLQ